MRSQRRRVYLLLEDAKGRSPSLSPLEGENSARTGTALMKEEAPATAANFSGAFLN